MIIRLSKKKKMFMHVLRIWILRKRYKIFELGRNFILRFIFDCVNSKYTSNLFWTLNVWKKLAPLRVVILKPSLLTIRNRCRDCGKIRSIFKLILKVLDTRILVWCSKIINLFNVISVLNNHIGSKLSELSIFERFYSPLPNRLIVQHRAPQGSNVLNTSQSPIHTFLTPNSVVDLVTYRQVLSNCRHKAHLTNWGCFFPFSSSFSEISSFSEPFSESFCVLICRTRHLPPTHNNFIETPEGKYLMFYLIPWSDAQLWIDVLPLSDPLCSIFPRSELELVDPEKKFVVSVLQRVNMDQCHVADVLVSGANLIDHQVYADSLKIQSSQDLVQFGATQRSKIESGERTVSILADKTEFSNNPTWKWTEVPAVVTSKNPLSNE